MSCGLSNITNLYYKGYVNRQNKAISRNNSIDFNSTLSAKRTENMSMTQEAEKTVKSNVETYQRYLEQKYGNVKIQSVGKDQQSLDKIGKNMSCNNVVIAPNILKQMANNLEKAIYYEGKIDDFFNATPRLKAQFAAKGLDYQPCGVVIHEDGSVTYIGGCADSLERVAEVNKINKAKMEKKAKQKKEYLEHISETSAKHRQDMNIYSMRKNMMEFIDNHSLNLFYFDFNE